MTLRYLSVCSGIETASIAWKPLGWTPVAFAEIEPFPCAVLAHHYGSNLPGEPLATNGVPNLGDITRFASWPDLAIDVLVGGTPCQSFSVAGLRKGLADSRGNLALVYLAIADRYRPAWVLWENVPGVLSSNEGRDFGAFLGGLGELGYGFAYRVLDAQYVRVDGFGRAVPQRRRRVFVVGHLGDWRRAAAVLFDAASLRGDPAPRRSERKNTARGPAFGISPDCFDRSGEGAGHSAAERSGLGVDEEVSYSLRAKRPGGVAVPLLSGGHSTNPLDENLICAPPLTSNPYGDHESREGLLVAHSLRADGFDASEDGTGRGTPLAPVAFTCKDHGSDAGEIAPTLRSIGFDGSHANGGGQVAVAFHENQRAEISISDTAGALKIGGGKPGQGYPSAMIGSAVRRLMPLECERLQGFPDHHTAVPFRGRPAADGPRYKALGNSMACNVIRWIGRRIELAEAA